MRTAVICADDFGIKCLQRLLDMAVDVRGVFTLGRSVYYNGIGKGMNPEFHIDFVDIASAAGIPLYKVKNINGRRNIERLKALRPEVIAVFSWSQIIRTDILQMPAHGVLGFHPSMLPERRGGAPLNWAIIDGLEQTGQTLFYYAEELDAGDIVAQREVRIKSTDNCWTLYEKLTGVALDILSDFWPKIEKGCAPRIVQDPHRATYRPRRRPEDGLINWTWPAMRIFNLVRGVTKPYPGAFTFFNDKKLTIWRAEEDAASGLEAIPGEIISVGSDSIVVATGRGRLALFEMELDGTDMEAARFARELDIVVGDRFRGLSEV